MTKPNSRVAQRMTSSASRLTSTPIWRVTKANSATKSRAAVPSIELALEPVKPSSRATASGSRPRLGAGQRPRAVRRVRRRRGRPSRAAASTSRSSGQAWASRWCDSSTGWACCRCVRPGMIAPRCCSRLGGQRVDEVERPGRRRPRRGRAGSTLNSVAIWSLRRAAGPQPAADVGADLLEQQPLERAVHVLVGRGRAAGRPSAYRSPSTSRPRSSSAWSSSVSSPAPCSALACAWEPARS